MNDKEKLFYHVVETAARCCSYTLKDWRQSITMAEVMDLTSIEGVEAYDVTNGYPEKLVFSF